MRGLIEKIPDPLGLSGLCRVLQHGAGVNLCLFDLSLAEKGVHLGQLQLVLADRQGAAGPDRAAGQRRHRRLIEPVDSA